MSQNEDQRFRGLYQAYQRPVLAYFLRRTDPTSARDGTAETFLVAWRRLEEVPDEQTLAWLYGVARKVLANQRRSERRWSALQAKTNRLVASESPSPETVVVHREEDQQMLTAVDRLRPADRDIIRLAVWEELPREEIATMFHTSTHAISQRLYRITKRLAHDLERAEVGVAVPLTPRPNEGGERL